MRVVSAGLDVVVQAIARALDATDGDSVCALVPSLESAMVDAGRMIDLGAGVAPFRLIVDVPRHGDVARGGAADELRDLLLRLAKALALSDADGRALARDGLATAHAQVDAARADIEGVLLAVSILQQAPIEPVARARALDEAMRALDDGMEVTSKCVRLHSRTRERTARAAHGRLETGRRARRPS
ncbi:MAG TPA: hypothetical protein VGO62_00490 [Myxococcota bacterium]